MKRHLLLPAALMLALSACDAVRVPVFNPSEADTALPEAGNEVAESPQAELPEGAPAIGGLTHTVDRAEPADAETPTEPAEDTEESTLAPASIIEPEPVEEAAPPLPSLAALNARICSLGSDGLVTPTVAAVAGATDVKEPTIGAEAVNGLAASLAGFPGLVKLEPRRSDASGYTTSGHCGATRIAEHWLVTAAHCVDEPYEEIRIIGEAENLRSPLAKITQGDGAICHGGYDGVANGYGNDLALIHLTDEEAAALPNVPVARFATTQQPLAPANYPSGEMAGWGLTHYGGQLSDTLLTTPLAITRAGPALITAASQDGAGPCAGDSGGPLYVSEADGTKTLVGVLSVVEQNAETGEFCAGNYNGRYTNLQGYAGWMQAVMDRCDADPDGCR